MVTSDVIEAAEVKELSETYEQPKPGLAPVLPSNDQEGAEAAQEHKERDYSSDIPNPHPWVLIGIR